jgi:hypothetical protein
MQEIKVMIAPKKRHSIAAMRITMLRKPHPAALMVESEMCTTLEKQIKTMPRPRKHTRYS